jgi:hypothetical protein
LDASQSVLEQNSNTLFFEPRSITVLKPDEDGPQENNEAQASHLRLLKPRRFWNWPQTG